MQSRARRGRVLERLPGAEKIQTAAEAGFADGQMLIGSQGGEACGQIVVIEKHIAGLGQAVLVGEIHIAEQPR